MEIKITIDEKELRDTIAKLMADKIAREYTVERNLFKATVNDAVREVVYKEKGFIIDRVVSRASAEIIRKSLPKLLEKLGDINE